MSESLSDLMEEIRDDLKLIVSDLQSMQGDTSIIYHSVVSDNKSTSSDKVNITPEWLAEDVIF